MFEDTIYSPVWWISVVFAGLFVSLSASYVKEFLDSFFEKISQRKRELNVELKKSFEAKVKLLKSDRGEFIEYIQITNDLSHRFLAAILTTIFIIGALNLLLLTAGDYKLVELDIMAKGLFFSGMGLLMILMVYAYAANTYIVKRRRVIDATRKS